MVMGQILHVINRTKGIGSIREITFGELAPPARDSVPHFVPINRDYVRNDTFLLGEIGRKGG
jgi:hypothetical protein